MSAYSLQFFGPGAVVDQRGRAVAMRSRKQLALLAYVATEHNVSHSRDALMALLWPDEKEASAHNNLRVTLSRLRDLSKSIAADGDWLPDLLHVDRYAAQLHPAWVARADVNRFEQLLKGQCRHGHGSRNQCDQCQSQLLEAVQLYRSEFLEGFGLNDCPAFEEWLFMQRERLRVLAVDAYFDLATYAEGCGDWGAAHGFTQRQIEMDPLREPAYRQHMRILAHRGERSLAAAAFERCRAALREALGIDPEPETLALHAQILAGEIEAAQRNAAPARAGATETAAPPRHNLPQQLTPFVGRDEELAQLRARLADPAYRLLSIVGPGGVGKSRLAHQAAAQHLNTFRDGVYFVSLAHVPAVESIPAAIAEALGLTFAAGQGSPAEQLMAMIGARQLLLVLDNFEHLIGGADLLVKLLQRAPNLVLLVTSRERLDVQAEDLFELQGLPAPDGDADASGGHGAAVRLFVDRARRLDKHFALTAQQLPYVARICQMVDGLPLGIELAATWVRDLTCREIVAELSNGLDRLETTQRDMDPQHRSLRAVFDASWRLLSDTERRTLARLTVFRGGFNADAARSIAGASPMLLGALRNKSLLRGAGARRYDMHALVHQFAAEALAAQPHEEARVRHAHSQTFLALLADQAVPLDTHDARAAADKIQPDWDDVAAAWQHAADREDLPLLQDALEGLVRFCDLRGLFPEAQALLEGALARLEPAFAAASVQEEGQRLYLRCRLLTECAYFAGRRGLDSARGLSQKALALAHELNSRADVISNYIIQATASELAGDFPRAVQLAERALRMAQEDGHDRHAGLCLDILGNIAMLSGQFDRANELYGQVLALHEKTGRLEQRGRAAIGYLGLVATEQGRYDAALKYNRRYLESCEAMDDRRNTAHAQHFLAYLWLRLGDFEKVIALEAQSAARAAAIGDHELRSFALHAKAWAHRYLSQLPAALECATESVAQAREVEARLALGFALNHLAEVQMALAEAESDWDEAAANFDEAAAIFRATDKSVMANEAEIGMAELARRRGAMDAARSRIAPILPLLPTVAADGWDEPIRAYVVCVRILRGLKDPAAEQLLDQGLRLLDCLAQNISDRNLRRKFLNAVPAHRELRALRFDEVAVS